MAGLNCLSCHQETNADSTGVPGGHNWHLAPLSMKWQTTNDQPLSSAEVCRAVGIPPLVSLQITSSAQANEEAMSIAVSCQIAP